jgi:hypothetical protein
MIGLLKVSFLLVVIFGVKSFHGFEAAFWALVLYVSFTNLNFEEKIKNLTSVLNNHSKKISPHLYSDDE